MMEEINSDDFCFIATFDAGYPIRNLIEYLKCIHKTGNFVFSKDKITYREVDSCNLICNDIYINTSLISSYKFNADGDILIGVQLNDLQNKTKQIGKKDGCCLYMRKDSPEPYLCIQPIVANRGSKTTIHFVRAMDVEINLWDMPIYRNTENKPNTTSQLSEFTKTCKNVGSVKADYVLVKCYPNGIRFTSYIEGKITGTDEKFGNCESDVNGSGGKLPDICKILHELDINNEVKREDLPTIRVRSKTFKDLAKINNISSNGIVTFHMEKDLPLKINCPIGHCGTLSILVKDMSK